MALIQDQMQQSAAGPATPMQPGRNASTNAEAPADDGRSDAEPAVLAAMKALYEDGLIDSAVEMVRSASMAAQGLADATYSLVASIDDSSGGMIPEEAMMPAASEVMGLLAEDCMKAGLDVRGRDIAIATQLMVIRMLEESGADVAQMKQAMNEVDYDKVGQMIEQQMAEGQQ